MVKKKPYDGVVVAVRYTPQGAIDWVMAFERHGFVFSDRAILKREAFVERLKAGKRFKTGVRKEYLGSDFDTFEDVRILEKNGSSVIVAGQESADRDFLKNLPIL